MSKNTKLYAIFFLKSLGLIILILSPFLPFWLTNLGPEVENDIFIDVGCLCVIGGLLFRTGDGLNDGKHNQDILNPAFWFLLASICIVTILVFHYFLI